MTQGSRPTRPNGNKTKRPKRTGRGTSEGLKPREADAVEYFIANGETSIIKAMVAAGYTTNYASVYGHEFLKRPAIARAIELKRTLISLKAEVSVAQAVRELAHIGFSDPRKLFRKIEMPQEPPLSHDAEPSVVVGRIGKKPKATVAPPAVGPQRQYYELIPVSELDASTAAAVAEVTVDLSAAGYVAKTKVKFWNKNDALEKIMRHLGGYAKDNAQKTDPIDSLSKDEREAYRRKLAERKAELLNMRAELSEGNAPGTKTVQ